MFSSFESEAFRLETLPQYKVAEENDELQRFLSGELFPTHANHREWLNALESWTSAGKKIIRVRVLPKIKMPYLRFEIEWAYLYNVKCGEEIFFLEEEDYHRLFDVPLYDWWMFDQKTTVKMIYGTEGDFHGGEYIPDIDLRYREVRDSVLSIAIPLKEYLRREREKTF